jgi:hypothetical protein
MSLSCLFNLVVVVSIQSGRLRVYSIWVMSSCPPNCSDRLWSLCCDIHASISLLPFKAANLKRGVTCDHGAPRTWFGHSWFD